MHADQREMFFYTGFGAARHGTVTYGTARRNALPDAVPYGAGSGAKELLVTGLLFESQISAEPVYGRCATNNDNKY